MSSFSITRKRPGQLEPLDSSRSSGTSSSTQDGLDFKELDYGMNDYFV